MLNVSQVLFREVCLRRKAVFLNPNRSTQVTLIGLFALSVSMNQHIGRETVRDCLYHPFLILGIDRGWFQSVTQLMSELPFPVAPVRCIG